MAADTTGPGTIAAEAVEQVERRAPAWAGRIAAFLSMAPAEPIVVSVYGGSGVARTKGAHVVLPVNGDGHAVLAGLAHELVHAVAGRSPSPVLNEGLAVHVDSELRLAGPVWPFYHLGPHRWMEVFREEGWRITLADLLATAASAPAADDRRSVRAHAVRYLHAASLTGYLIQRAGMEQFWGSFRSGQVVPAGDDAASVDEQWLARIATPLSADERRLRDLSFGVMAHAPPVVRHRAPREGGRV